MMISSTYSQNLTMTFSATITSRMDALRRTQDDSTPPAPVKETPPAPVKETPAPVADDRFELSRDAKAARSTAPTRGDALFRALDADQDGAITEQEFTEGAIALLRRAGARHRDRDNDRDDDGDGETRRVNRESRLTNRLQRVFDRVDANEDGAIAKDELTSALARTTARRRTEEGHRPVEQPAIAPAPTPDPGASRTETTTSVTRMIVVTVAIQQYTAMAHLPEAAPQSTSDHLQATSHR